ncbi:serine/arginine-rich splicing factor SR45a-like [Pyrus x bretschneideri]|uniref:serine/arginine-rich splicing factor SR45a-like n=1 Tax=Pyrus x bretschneideri TaxID=225117 RepID=UPI00202F9EDF|nr:serine/arginine-rich splicing factor SR45a-like [Pyrus x bretschneideri]
MQESKLDFKSLESVDASNTGNNLYITGLSTSVASTDLDKFFNNGSPDNENNNLIRIELTVGHVLDCNLVTDPCTGESRGFGFVIMETVEDAERCIKYFDRSVLEDRLVTVERDVIVIMTADDHGAIHVVGG